MERKWLDLSGHFFGEPVKGIADDLKLFFILILFVHIIEPLGFG